MKILYATDLHGHRGKYQAVENLAVREGVAAVVQGGDLLPHGNPLHRVQREFVDDFLAPHIEKLAAAGIAFLGILGNDDLRAVDAQFDAACARVQGAHSIAGKKVALNGYEFLGLDLVPDCPFRLKDRCRRDREGFLLPPQNGRAVFSTAAGFREVMDWPEEVGALPTIEEELARLPAPENPSRAVYVIHTPPSGLGLDLCAGGRGGRGLAVGSRAVHEFLRRVQPRMSLHGHIHESPDVGQVWSAPLGQTVCIQPGSREDLAGVLIDLETRGAVLKHI